MGFTSLAIWKQAVTFYLTCWKNLLPIFPLLCVPVLGDALHSLLIMQKIERENLFPMQAVKEVWRLIPSLLGMKLYFEGAALLWGLIPIYGIIQGAKHRMYWAMASNVLVFERLSGKAGRERCRELVKGFLGGIGVRTLITVPALVSTLLLIAWVINATFFETSSTYGFWVFVVAVFWIIIPGSGAVNTFCYVEIRKESVMAPQGNEKIQMHNQIKGTWKTGQT